MTDFEKSVISLLKVIANGQMVMLAAMPKMVGTGNLISGHQELLETVFQKIDARRQSAPSGEQSQDQAHDGTGEQKDGSA
jgi:hypothetical protein